MIGRTETSMWWRNAGIFFLLANYILLFGVGCTAHRAGSISVSDSLVWQDHAVAAASDAPYRAIQQVGKSTNENLGKFQGQRARRSYQAQGFKGAFKVQFPSGATMEGNQGTGTTTAQPQTGTTTGGTSATPATPPALLDAPPLLSGVGF
jgi:hypothetical protein